MSVLITSTSIGFSTRLLKKRAITRSTNEATPPSERLNTADLPLEEPVIGQQLEISLQSLLH